MMAGAGEEAAMTTSARGVAIGAAMTRVAAPANGGMIRPAEAAAALITTAKGAPKPLRCLIGMAVQSIDGAPAPAIGPGTTDEMMASRARPPAGRGSPGRWVGSATCPLPNSRPGIASATTRAATMAMGRPMRPSGATKASATIGSL